MEAFHAKVGINASVELCHVHHGAIVKVEHVVGDIGDTCLYFGIFVDGNTVNENFTAIGAINACDVADNCGFTAAVGADQTVDGASGHGKTQIVQSGKITETLGDAFYFNHASFPPSRM